jgi:hypothetical protein
MVLSEKERERERMPEECVTGGRKWILDSGRLQTEMSFSQKGKLVYSNFWRQSAIDSGGDESISISVVCVST